MKNKKLASQLVYDGGIIRLRVDEVELPDGRRTQREVIEHPGAAAVVPLDADGNVRLVRQFRDAVGRDLLEIPAGKLKPGEDPADCARRELGEELALAAGELEHLATFYSTPGFCDEVMHVFLARQITDAEPDRGREEFITAEIQPLEPVGELLAQLEDSKSIAGILLAYEKLTRQQA